MNVSFLQELLTSVAERGRQLLPSSLNWNDRGEDISELAQELVSGRGEASGVAIASEILTRYRSLDPKERQAFLTFLARTMQPDADALARAANAYLDEPGPGNLLALQQATESPRLEFFRRLNLAPGATAAIVSMRRDLIKARDATLNYVDRDLMHLLASWFNRGFLVLRRIDWQTPAAILDKIIAYEAVHEIQGWDDLRRRLDPTDRRCFAFFHPSLIDEPLIFVEVALTDEIPGSIQALLHEAPKDGADVDPPTTAVFYSISNCQEGLRGISFGNFLIKQVVEDLIKERNSLKTFVTLSPIPGFARWLASVLEGEEQSLVSPAERVRLKDLDDPKWIKQPEKVEALKPIVTRLAAHYMLNGKDDAGRPIDPVARFHLGNGARLERINWQGDVSINGLRASHGLMCNYRYELRDIEKNHEAFANEGTVAASRTVQALLKGGERSRAERGKLLALTTLRPARLTGPPTDEASER